MRQINICVHGRDPGRLSDWLKSLKPLKYHLQLKTKEDVGGRGLEFQRQFTWRWKSTCLLGQQRPWDTEWPLIAKPLWSPPHPILWWHLHPRWWHYSFIQILPVAKGEVKRDLLSLLFLKNNQPKLILMVKRHILGCQILLLHGPAFETSPRSLTVQKLSW